MAEKEQSSHILATSNGYVGTDAEAVRAQYPDDLRKKKRMKCIAYIVAFAVFQTAVILVFVLTVMRFKSPKFRVRDASFTGEFEITNSSFKMQMNAQFTVKNTNFGHFKYEDGIVRFEYRGMTVGVANIGDGRARARSTKKFNASLFLSSSNLASNSELESDLGTALLPLTCSSKLDGKVHLLKVIKKKKSAEMKCTMDVNVGFRTIRNLKCN